MVATVAVCVKGAELHFHLAIKVFSLYIGEPYSFRYIPVSHQV